jgi:hypothetical protein
MTEKRLRWARDWLERTIANKVVRVEEFRSALGRLAFMMSAFVHLKPLLGPLYSSPGSSYLSPDVPQGHDGA